MSNICKFIPESTAYSAEVFNFVCETDQIAMRSNHTLQTNRLCLVSRGAVLFNHNGHTSLCSLGDIIFLFEGECVFAEPDEHGEFLYISFKSARTDELFRRFEITPAKRRHSGFDGLIPLWTESLTRALNDNIDLVAESMLIYTFSRLTGQSSETADLINKIVDVTEKSFTDSDLSLSRIAEEMNYNPKYLSHLFRQKMGLTYTEYLRVLRMKYAISLLDHGIDSIKNVALLSGFSDPLYFSTVFKASVGRSPKDYILSRQAQAEENSADT